jgi:hypothetical protein
MSAAGQTQPLSKEELEKMSSVDGGKRMRTSSLGGEDDAARALGLETLAKMRQIQALKDKQVWWHASSTHRSMYHPAPAGKRQHHRCCVA